MDNTIVALSADGTSVVVGCPYDLTSRGIVRVFCQDSDDTGWDQVGYPIHGTNDDDSFGCAVDITDDGSRISVGACGGDYVRVFQVGNGTWTSITKFTGPSDTNFGAHLSMSGDWELLVVSADDDDKNEIDSGSIYLYNVTSVVSFQCIVGDAEDEFFGWSVSMVKDGSILALGSKEGPFVSVFKKSNGKFSQHGERIDGEGLFKDKGRFGRSVSFSHKGAR